MSGTDRTDSSSLDTFDNTCRGRELCAAARRGNLTAVRRCLDEGYNVNVSSSGWTPLMDASRYGKIEIVKELIERNADVNAQNMLGATALICASLREGDRQVVVELLKKTNDINLVDKWWGWTALMYASRQGKLGVVQALLQGKADPNFEDAEGTTALTEATCYGKLDIVRELLNYGAVVNLNRVSKLSAMIYHSRRGSFASTGLSSKILQASRRPSLSSRGNHQIALKALKARLMRSRRPSLISTGSTSVSTTYTNNAYTKPRRGRSPRSPNQKGSRREIRKILENHYMKITPEKRKPSPEKQIESNNKVLKMALEEERREKQQIERQCSVRTDAMERELRDSLHLNEEFLTHLTNMEEDRVELELIETLEQEALDSKEAMERMEVELALSKAQDHQEIKRLHKEVDDLRSGEEIKRLEKEIEDIQAEDLTEIQRLQQELEETRKRAVAAELKVERLEANVKAMQRER